MRTPPPGARSRFDPAHTLAVAAPLALDLAAYTQGLSLLDDGLWLLGGKLKYARRGACSSARIRSMRICSSISAEAADSLR
jgi:hypothetical protein